MKYSTGPTPGPTPIVSPTSLKPEIVRIECARYTQADCGMAWRIFSDISRWRIFSDAYRSIEWRGEPWAPGSRLQIDIVKPVVARQDRVITMCTPPRGVAWINHVLGYSMEQWVMFDPGRRRDPGFHLAGNHRLRLSRPGCRRNGHANHGRLVLELLRGVRPSGGR